MPSTPNRSRSPSISSIGTFATTPSDESQMSSPPSDPTPEPRGVGLSDPDQSAHRRMILGVIDRMRATGVGADMDLPMIAVIGSQSAGKSSLIESISGITLPRAAGTCTRCPTECRLSYSNQPWSCKVALRKTVDRQGHQLGVAENVSFGDVIRDKKDVEERIRRAQRAILNPTAVPEVFLSGPDGDPDGGHELSFSKNCVCLELSGPDLADLSFCDLPGLIASVSQGSNESDIELVRDLVRTYIERPSCLILLTVTCETDFENQGAHHMAKHYDPDGRRTIGVLTKPDRIPEGEEGHWLRFIRGEAEPLTNGWFTVKQPASVDLRQGINWEEARQQEQLFFTTTSPWSTERDYRHRFGTRNLTSSLSNILSDLIRQRLPQLAVELHELLKETKSQLSELPAAPSDDAQGEVISLVSGLARELSTYVEGTPDDNGIHQLIRPFNRGFSEAIRSTAPRLSPFRRDDREETVEGLESGLPFTHPECFTPAIEPEIYNDDVDTICVDEVMEMADGARARELPGHSLFVVTKRLIKISTDQWETPSYELLENVYTVLVREVNRMIDERFPRFRYGRLHKDVKSIVGEVLAKCQIAASEMIKQLLTMEGKAPFTLHEPHLIASRERYLSGYRQARELVLRGESSLFLPSERLILQDTYYQALVYMAIARAYFLVAFQRFTDMVAMMIDQELLRGVDWDRGLYSALTKGLGITGPGSFEKAKAYLQEPPNIRSRRESLLRKHERLLSAKRELQSI